MAKYKSTIAKTPKKSPAAKQAEQRAKGMRQIKSGKYEQGVKSISEANKSRRMTQGEKRAVSITPFVPKQVPQPPQTPKSLKGLSMAALMKSSPRLMKENALECYVSNYKRGKTPKGLPFATAKVRHKDPLRPNKTVRLHECMFLALDDPNKPISKQKRVLASCGCENYVFMWEYANAEHGAARIIYGNGEPPGFTNPAHVPGLCKHLLALADVIRRNGD
ncbi:hypothetical protein YOLOSWAG_227 [Erwinia phage vB_EamM_Yoloswag]|uniref:Uncharacterized protein n=1 Tax=Erwinia phage vB_EamM_Yoloswag TaxID=1958956 RepID=A0A1S6L3E1_9CAUD|nr:hypothetical protein HOR66_gp227 [Erwinia phage vB_EamM_Yoloswag]AQT28705.1 hypothetical protein YOLOSWAG_227 [Erwinia phage vB_EamM_Yoloswag]